MGALQKCNRCLKMLPPEDFHRGSSPLGRQYDCKVCRVEINRRYRQRPGFVEKRRLYTFAYATVGKGRAKRDEYKKRHLAQYRERHNELNRLYYKKSKEKKFARKKVSNEIEKGTITRGPCQVCGTTDNIHAHHEDYSRPLAIEWLCVKHHGERHRKYEIDKNGVVSKKEA